MKNAKLYALMATLSSEERKRLYDYAQSPYFNQRAEVSRLAGCFQELGAKELPDANVCWTHLYPTEPFDAKAWSYLASGLLRLAEEFIALEDLRAQPASWELHCLRASAKRGLDKSYRRQAKRFEKLMANEPVLTEPHLRLQHDFQRLSVEWGSRLSNRNRQADFQQLLATLETDYLARKWRIACEMHNQQAVQQRSYQLAWYGPQDNYEQLPHNERAELFRRAYQLLQNPNQGQLLSDFIAALGQHAEALDQPTRTALFQMALNYCARQIRAGHHDFRQRLLDLYILGLDRAYLLNQGMLSPFNYKNIVKLGLGLGQFEWVRDIIERYTDLLPDHTRHDAYHYSLADLHYYRHEYNRALAYLRDTEFSDQSYALGARAMLLKIYYEQQETEPLYALFSSFYIYLLRQKSLAKATKDAYLNFLRFTKRLERAKSDETLEKLRLRVEQSSSLNARSWLLTQIDQRLKT